MYVNDTRLMCIDIRFLAGVHHSVEQFLTSMEEGHTMRVIYS